jgi:hypothetical protein
MHQIPELDDKGLRQFALVTGAIVVALFGLLLPWLFGFEWPAWPWVLTAVLVSTGMAVPKALRPVYKSWMRFGLILNYVTTPIILGIVFYLLITPFGLVRRLVAKDPMARRINNETSYRVASVKRPAKSMERPF